MATARARAVALGAGCGPASPRRAAHGIPGPRLTASQEMTERTWLAQTASQGRGLPRALCHTGDCGTGIRTLQKKSVTVVHSGENETDLVSERVCIRARATAVAPHCESPLKPAWKVLPHQVQRVVTRDAPRRIVWVIECLQDETCNGSIRNTRQAAVEPIAVGAEDHVRAAAWRLARPANPPAGAVQHNARVRIQQFDLFFGSAPGVPNKLPTNLV